MSQHTKCNGRLVWTWVRSPYSNVSYWWQVGTRLFSIPIPYVLNKRMCTLWLFQPFVYTMGSCEILLFMTLESYIKQWSKHYFDSCSLVPWYPKTDIGVQYYIQSTTRQDIWSVFGSKQRKMYDKTEGKCEERRRRRRPSSMWPE